MRRLASIVIPTCVVPLACVVNNPYDGDTFDTLGSQSADASSEAGSETLGDGDGDPATGDGDGDPTTTGDGDGDPTTTGDGDGDPTTTGDGDGDPTTTGDGDGDSPDPCTRYQFSYTINTDTWEELPLDQVWTGPNAPPCSVEPAAATSIQDWDQLLVWGTDGMFYRRVQGAWDPPEPIADRWGVVANVGFDGVSVFPPFPGTDSARVLFGVPGTAYGYNLFEDGSTVYTMSVPLSDGPLPAPPSASETLQWAATVANPNLHPAAEWVSSYSFYDDGRIYYVEGFSDWSSWLVGSDPLFGDPPAGVGPATMEAAWGQVMPKKVLFVGTK